MIRIIGISFTEGNDKNPEQSFPVHAHTRVTAAIDCPHSLSGMKIFG
jgi:hypothetical protein